MTITEMTSPTGAKLRWWALAVLMLPVLLVAVDNTVLSLAFPKISEALRPTGVELLWIVDVYPLVLAGLLIPMGSLGDRFGRRKLLLIGATGFAAVSAIAAFAPTAGALIGLRAAMGFFGAMIMPATLSLIRNIFIDPNERRLAIAIWAAMFSGGAALGPLVGGFLLEHFWWGSVFLLAVPVLLPLLVFGLIVLPESKDPNPSPIDPLSTGLVLVAMTGLVWSIKSITVYGPTLEVLGAFAVALSAGAWFVHRQLSNTNPMLDVRLFGNPVFSGAVAANLLSVFSMVGFLFFVSQHLQLVSGRTPLEAGLVLLPGLAVTVVAGLLVVRIARRVSPGTIIVSGMLLNAVGYAVVMASGQAGSDLGLLLAFVLLGAGVGAAETISNDLIMSSVPAAKAGAASAISETAYEVGSVLGTAVLGGLLTAVYRGGVQIPAGLTPEQTHAAQETLGGAIDVAAGLPAAMAEPLLESARTAFDSGVLITAGIGLALMLVAAAMARVTLKNA